jgi:hypothetical protein
MMYPKGEFLFCFLLHFLSHFLINDDEKEETTGIEMDASYTTSGDMILREKEFSSSLKIIIFTIRNHPSGSFLSLPQKQHPLHLATLSLSHTHTQVILVNE